MIGELDIGSEFKIGEIVVHVTEVREFEIQVKYSLDGLWTREWVNRDLVEGVC